MNLREIQDRKTEGACITLLKSEEDTPCLVFMLEPIAVDPRAINA